MHHAEGARGWNVMYMEYGILVSAHKQKQKQTQGFRDREEDENEMALML